MKKVEARPAQKADPIGEIVSASITGWVAESWSEEDDGLPAAYRPGFGDFLRVDAAHELSIFSVVYNVVTGPQDNNHRPSAMRLTRQQLKVEQPHIFALLKTEIHAVTIGYADLERTVHHLPPHPPEVHDFVYPAVNAEIEAITSGLDFLRLVAGVSAVPPDELLAAAIRAAYAARANDYQFLVEAGQALSHLFRDDYDRLVSILRKLKSD